MTTENPIKRLFFAFEVVAPWPDDLPSGRLLEPGCRHLTLAFLGNIPFAPLCDRLDTLPLLPLRLGPVGFFNRSLFLPPSHPRVVAWHVHWLENLAPLTQAQQQLSSWLRSLELTVDERPFLPHVTLCRSPFNLLEWKEQFTPLPLMVKNLHLYESKGQLTYEAIWSYPYLKPPFRKIEYAAAMTFEIYGESIRQLYRHAFVALAFQCPHLLHYFDEAKAPAEIDQLVMALNEAITQADQEHGCPFQAVSFYGDIQQDNDQLFTWKIIVE